MRAVKWTELVKVCEGEGCQFDRQRGDHYIMTKPGLSRPIVIPRKKDLKELVVLNTGKLLGLNRNQILERLTSSKGRVNADDVPRAQRCGRARAASDDYRADLDLVFANPQGDYLKPNTVSPAVCELARKCGFKGVGLHTLRHTHGSQLISAGVPSPVVSERLGHSSVDFTAKVYVHAFAADEIAAAELWDKKIGAAIRQQTPWQHVAARQPN